MPRKHANKTRQSPRNQGVQEARKEQNKTIHSGTQRTIVVVLGVPAGAEAAGLEVGEDGPDQLAKGRRVDGLLLGLPAVLLILRACVCVCVCVRVCACP